MVMRKDAKTNVLSSTSTSGKAQPTEFLAPQSKAEFSDNFVELRPFSTGMLIYNYFLYTVWSILSVATIGGILCAPA